MLRRQGRKPMVRSMTHFSRSQWAQMTKRAKLSAGTFDRTWKCIVCGTKFTECLHTVDENTEVIREIDRRKGLQLQSISRSL